MRRKKFAFAALGSLVTAFILVFQEHKRDMAVCSHRPRDSKQW